MQYKKRRNTTLRVFNIIFDLLFFNILFFLFLYIHYPNWDKSIEGLKVFFLVHYKSYFFLLFAWFIISHNIKYYLIKEDIKLGTVLQKTVLQSIFFSIALLAISGLKDENLYSNFESLVFSFFLFVYCLVSKLILYIITQLKLKQGHYLKNAIIIGQNKVTDSFLKSLKERKDFVYVEKIYSDHNFNENDYLNHLRNPKLEIIYLSLNSGLTESQVDYIVYEAQNNYKRIEFISDTFMDFSHNMEVKYYDTFPVLGFSRFPLDYMRNQFLKRVFDICFSLVVLSILIPFVYPIIALFIYFDSGFPFLYRQKRNGLFGKEFLCLKFRTMKPNKDNDIKATVRGDSRVTKIGRILRKTSLDELPQFINVLKGEMSIVGPRPHMISQDEHYAKIINKYTLRHYVKPGITGLAQVKGYRGEINSDRDMELRILTDIFYVRNWSFFMDIVIIIKTALKMFLGDKNAI